MFWADIAAEEIINSGKYKPYWVDDMKTPSGKIHVGSLRGVIVHDLVYKALLDAKVKAKYTYVFDSHDPMDSLPVYLPKEKYEKYLGMPLFKVPSPQKGFKNYAEYYAKDFIDVFMQLGCKPEVLWSTDLYESGKMNESIKQVLDKTEEVKKIYEELYKKTLSKDWYPFQVYCTNCGKVSTTQVIDWDGKEVSFVCNVDRLNWTKGCSFKGKVSPFSSKGHIAGKLPWKIEWAVKWKVIGITIEGAGKDHMSKGGSHDLASLICERIINYPVPYPIPYEFFLIGGKKMSSSKGVGTSASDILEILPLELARFLMVKAKLNQQINFDPYEKDTIPVLFDEYQKAADAYFNKDKENKDLARVFELSKVGKEIKKPPKIRFSVLAQWVQMPNMQDEIKKEGLAEWVKYAKVWLEKYAPESEKFTIAKNVPDQIKHLSNEQKELLSKIEKELDKKWVAEDFQTEIYNIGKELGLNGKDTFAAIYLSILGIDHGPKAAWLILSLDKEFIKKRFKEASK